MKVGETFYHSVRNIDDKDLVTYSVAKPYRTQLGYITCQPASGYTETLEFGEKISKTWTIVANYNLFNKVFNEGDLLFLDGAKPTNIELYDSIDELSTNICQKSGM